MASNIVPPLSPGHTELRRRAIGCDSRNLRLSPTRLRYFNLSFVVTLGTMGLQRIWEIIVGSHDTVVRWLCDLIRCRKTSHDYRMTSWKGRVT
jgi:hypothetical protein